MNLDQILQDALEYEKMRDVASPGEWIADGPFIVSNYYARFTEGIIGPKRQLTEGRIIGHTENYSGDLNQDLKDSKFIAAAKNYDSPKIIRELVERVKALTDDFEEAQIIIKDLLKMGLI